MKSLFSLVASLALGSFAWAGQDTVPLRSFEPADFAQFAPRTALDMVREVPGFSIRNDDGERGFGQASGNVLINGQRPSTKSEALSDILRRIPAANVERLDLLEGASLDIPGLTGQVINVVARIDSVSGAWSWRARFRENLPPFYDNIDASMTGRRGALTWRLGLVSDPGRGANAGLERVSDGAGNLIETRAEDFNFVSTNVTGTAGLSWAPASGRLANLSVRYAIEQADEREISLRAPAGGPPERYRRFAFAEDLWNAEVGGDYEFAVGPGRLKLIGLSQFQRSPFEDRLFGIDLDGSDREESVFTATTDEGESILRGEYSLSRGEGRTWQVSLEGAFNFLDQEAALAELDLSGELVPVPLPGSSVRVEERRGEAFLSHGRALGARLSLQLALGAEYSELSSTNGAQQARNFFRPKGSISAAYAFSDTLTLNASLSREVGQLDFFDFVSSVDLNDGDAAAGNPDIVPDQRWIAEFEAEHDFGDFGAANFRLFGETIEDIVDRVPFGPEAEGPGNLDNATRAGVSADATVRLAAFGWTGAQLDLQANYRTSSVDDPLTGESRRINGQRIYEYELGFRHDVPQTDWAWGLNYEFAHFAPRFRLDARTQSESVPGFGDVFVEHKDLFGLTGTVSVGNLFDQDDQRTRERFEPRRTGVLVLVEDRTRNFGPVVNLRLRGQF